MTLKPSASSLLISLSTFPEFQTDNYLDSLVSNLNEIKKKRERLFELANGKYDTYFEPLIYVLWGFWDLSVLAVSDNSEIITEVLHMEKKPTYNPEGQISSKLYSGISFEDIGQDLSEISKISKTEKYPFIGIVNLKFSEKWLLSNGQELVYRFLKYVNILSDGDYKDLIFFPVHTFNTYEISIVILGNELNRIEKSIFEIREMRVSDLPEISVGSLKKINPDYLNEDRSHLFIDTQSHFGARLIKQKVDSDPEQNSSWSLAPNINFNGIKAVFEIEAKPGHTKDIEMALDEVIGPAQSVQEMYFQAGQYDFYLNWDYNSDVFKNIYNDLRNQESRLRKHIRKLRTRFLFDYETAIELDEKQEIRKDRTYFDIVKINKSLKVLKVSKSLRNQIIKLFYSFQNSLLNGITFCVYIDLFYYVKKLETEIYKLEQNIIDFFDIKKPYNKTILCKTVQCIEKQLGFYVAIYKDSYYLRYVNDRSIVDVQDFLIPHNTQLQVIIGFYDSYVKSIISTLIGPEHGNSFIITFDEHITEVNPISIKLLSNNLFEPGLIFTALSKEISTICANFPSKGDSTLLTLKEQLNPILKTDISNYFEKNPDSKYIYYRDLFERFNYTYGVVDYLRYKYFFCGDYKLFLFYHIGFIMQYPKMYDSAGNFNNYLLFNEVLRVLIFDLIIKNRIIEEEGSVDDLFNIEDLYMTPETRSLWIKYMSDIRGFLTEFEHGSEERTGFYHSLNHLILHNETKLNYKSLLNPTTEEENFASEYIKLSYNFMKNVSEKSKYKFLGLSRDWMNGKLFDRLVKSKKKLGEPYFLLDSQGGAYFVDFENLKQYSEVRNKIFEDLRHKSLLYKAQLYKNISKDEETESFKFI